MSAPPAIHVLNDQLKRWLFDHALPLWSEVGVDRARGGFFERIDLAGRAVEAECADAAAAAAGRRGGAD